MDLPADQVDRPRVHSRMDDETRALMHFLRKTSTGERWFTMIKRNHQFRNPLDAKSFIATTVVLDAEHRQHYQGGQPVTDRHATYTLQDWGQEFDSLRSRMPVLDDILTELLNARYTSLRDQLRDALERHPIPSWLPPGPRSFPRVFPNTGNSTPTTVMSGASTARTRMSGYSTPATRRSALGSPGYMTGSSPSRTATPASTLGSATPALSSASQFASPANRTPALGPHFDQAEHARQLCEALTTTVLRPDLEWPEASSTDWDNNSIWTDTDTYMPYQQNYEAGHQYPPVAYTGYGYVDYNTHGHENHYDPYSSSRSAYGPVDGVAISAWDIPARYPPASSDPNQLINQHLTTVTGDPAHIRRFVANAPRLPHRHRSYYDHSQGYYQ